MSNTFKLLVGKHQRKEDDVVVTYDANDPKMNIIKNEERNLVEMFGADKFEQLHNYSPQEDPDDLNNKTVAELKELAEELEVDISGLTRKDEIIAALGG